INPSFLTKLLCQDNFGFSLFLFRIPILIVGAIRMRFAFHWSDYLVFAFWLLIYSLIGIYHRFRSRLQPLLCRQCDRQETNPDYIDSRKDLSVKVEQIDGDADCDETNDADTESLFLGGRQLSLFPILSSVMASFLSAVSLMGTCSEAYFYGIQFILMIVAYVIGFSLTAEVYMPVFYKLRYLELRFNKAVRSVTSLVFCIQMWIYIALALYAPSLAFSQVSGLPLWVSIVSTGLVATFYTALGGLRAVVWTDVIQLVILVFGMLLVVILGIIRIGGLEKMWNIALSGDRLQSFSFSLNPWIRHSVWALMFGGGGMVLSIYATNQTQVQRYMACCDLITARRAILLNIPLNAMFLVIQLLSGLVAYAYFVGCDPLKAGEVTASDQILPYLIMALFNGIPVVKGLFLSVIFAAALSTVSSGVNSLATVVLEDILRPLFILVKKKDLSKRVKTICAFVLAATIGSSTVGLAFIFTVVSPGVLQFSFSLFGAVGGPILTIFTMGMIIPCINSIGGLLGMLASLAVGLWLSIGAIVYPTPAPKLPLSTENCSFINGTTIAVGSSTLSSPSLNIYSVSYLYYTPICLITGVLVGLVVSAMSKFNNRSPVASSLLAWQARKFYARCPSCLPPQTANDTKWEVICAHFRQK
ncbi:Sodium-coupled monocarboxylate transporter 1, partial [Fasciolopsis buskii]